MELEEAERHSDPLDQATDLTIALVDAARDENARRLKPEQEQNADGTWPVTECRDCGEDLGQRAALGKVRCTDCQTETERKRR